MADPDERLALHLLPEPAAVGEARRAALALLGRWDRTDLSDDIGTVLSELVTNAFLHAGTDIDLALFRVGSGVRLEVTDRAPDLLPREVVQAPVDWFAELDAEWDPLDAESMTGRGLLLVGQLADGWGVDVADGTKTV
ncbi:MAG: regulatory protein, partial [Actinomycetia bacterium]|nr:regulatory protein [Actinomycetes bacterium]